LKNKINPDKYLKKSDFLFNKSSLIILATNSLLEKLYTNKNVKKIR